MSDEIVYEAHDLDVTEFSAENSVVTQADMVRADSVLDRLDNVESQLFKLTSAVNQFGSMMQYMVDQVSGLGQAVAKGGLGGLMAMFKDKSNG